MATLILSAVGTVFGGPLGGALGALIGQQFDAALIGRRKVEGPRLKELSVQTSSYGSPLPLHFGTVRASGSVIWATELTERAERSGGGKGRPSVTSYSYSASFAVAVASRPIAGIGRIWADGNLLRGAEGDLKVAGKLRVHTGHGDQSPDPLLVQAEGPALNPAYRHTAYAVFEDLDLAEFGNRLPSLTFEIIADADGVTLADVCHVIDETVESTDLEGIAIAGFSLDRGGATDAVAVLGEIVPMSCIVRDERIVLKRAEVPEQQPPPILPAACAGWDTTEDALVSGWTRKREAMPVTAQCAVRYYDIARDYQPGLQRSVGRHARGDVSVIELPAVMTAEQAAGVADRAALRGTRARDTLRYRISEIDQRFAAGALVRTAVAGGIWRVEEWEWLADGVLLNLVSVQAQLPPGQPADSGRANVPLDVLIPPTQAVALELPWDGRGDANQTIVRAAATASIPGWRGAALYARQPDEALLPLGSTGRSRAVMGAAVESLPASSPLLLDRCNSLLVELAGPDLILDNATWAQLMQGANLALIGNELVQFATAERVGGRTWKLRGFLRGRGGTEDAMSSHLAGEPFVLIDDRLTVLDPALIGGSAPAMLAAIGLGDADAVTSRVINAGLSLRPLSPVHGKATIKPDGGLELTWTRRARGSWAWLDLVDVPLNEPQESWEVRFGASGQTVAFWTSSAPQLRLDAATFAGITAEAPSGIFEVRQIGRSSLSAPLLVPLPA